MFCHVSTARLSPNHWWASSWTTTPSFGWLGPKKNGEYVGRVWFSSANPTLDVVDDPAGRRERVRPEGVGLPADDLRLAVERLLGAGPDARDRRQSRSRRPSCSGSAGCPRAPARRPSHRGRCRRSRSRSNRRRSRRRRRRSRRPGPGRSRRSRTRSRPRPGAGPRRRRGAPTDQCSQPSDAPLTAFQTPVVPDGVQRRKSSLGSAGSPGSAMNGVT